MYGVNKFGFTDISPKRIIEIKENPSVFGILLLPSIKQIMHDPGHSKIKTIKLLKEMTDKKIQDKGWIRSRPKDIK